MEQLIPTKLNARDRPLVDIQHMSMIDTIPTNLLVPHYLVHSYLYYQLDHSVIDDASYDKLARRVDEEWENIQHRHRNHIQREYLRTTGFALTYPLHAINTAKMIYEQSKPKSYLTERELMSINARSKGQRGEREIIDLLQPHINEVSRYNNMEPPLLQRNTLQSHQGGYDIVGLSGYAIEVKRVETEQPGQVEKWWEQTTRQAKEGEVPVLFYRMNKKPWKVRLKVRLPLDAGRVYQIPADITVPAFIFWMKARLHTEQVKALTKPPVN